MFSVLEDSCSVLWTHHRSPYLRVVLLAITVHLLLFVLTPPFQFHPYQLEEKEPPIEVKDIPEIIIPPPPKEIHIPSAVIPVDDTGLEESVIPPSIYDNLEDVPTLSTSVKTQIETFIPYDEPPVPIHYEKPEYPELARQAGLEGIVHIRIVINTDGRVISAVVESSDATRSMETAALEAAKKCLFKPARQRDVPVSVTVIIPFEFRLID